MAGVHWKIECSVKGCDQKAEAYDSDTINAAREAHNAGWRVLYLHGKEEGQVLGLESYFCPIHADGHRMGCLAGSGRNAETHRFDRLTLGNCHRRIVHLENKLRKAKKKAKKRDKKLKVAESKLKALDWKEGDPLPSKPSVIIPPGSGHPLYT